MCATTNFDSTISSDPKNILFQMHCVSSDVIDLEKKFVFECFGRGGVDKRKASLSLVSSNSPVANACEHETCLTNAPFPFHLC